MKRKDEHNIMFEGGRYKGGASTNPNRFVEFGIESNGAIMVNDSRYFREESRHYAEQYVTRIRHNKPYDPSEEEY